MRVSTLTIVFIGFVYCCIAGSSLTEDVGCDEDCWSAAVEDQEDAMLGVARDEDTSAVVTKIEDWQFANLLGYYMYDLEYGKLIDYKNGKDLQSLKMWIRYNDIMTKYAETGEGFEDHRREKIMALGAAGKKVYGYNDIDDLDLSFDTFILTQYGMECGPCEAFWDSVVGIVRSLLSMVGGSAGYTLALGFEIDYIIYHVGFKVGVALAADFSNAGVFVSRWSGWHTLEVGYEGFIDACVFRTYGDIAGTSNYIGVNIDGTILDFGFTTVWSICGKEKCESTSSHYELIGLCGSQSFGPSFGSPVQVSAGHDCTDFIWGPDAFAEVEEETAYDLKDYIFRSYINYDYIYHIIGGLMIIGAIIISIKMGLCTENDYKQIPEEAAPLL